MKKLAIFDPNGYKFTRGMINWWKEHGYEVKSDRYYDPDLVVWADIVWFDTCDNNLKSGMYPDPNDPTMAGWDMHNMDLSQKKIIVRAIDIEVWYGHQENVDWNLVNDTIFIAPHIQEVANRTEKLRNSKTRQHFIPCGIDLDEWTFKERKPGNKVALVCEVWESKGVDLALQIALKLRDTHEFHWLGPWQDYEWDKAYTRDFIAKRGLPFTFYDWVESVDDFLEDKNYLLHPSKKEAFSYATAEAMAKGIKPVLHRFYGAGALWPGLVWNSIDEAVEMLTSQSMVMDSLTPDRRQAYNSHYYRQYLIDHGYTLPQMMEKIEEVING